MHRCLQVRLPFGLLLQLNSFIKILRNASLEFHTFIYSYCCSVPKLCLTLCDPMDCSTPGFLVPHHLPKLVQTHVHWIDDAIQPSHPLMLSFSLAFNLSQHQGLFRWISSLHHVAKVLGLQLQHQPFQWIFRIILGQTAVPGKHFGLVQSRLMAEFCSSGIGW